MNADTSRKMSKGPLCSDDHMDKKRRRTTTSSSSTKVKQAINEKSGSRIMKGETVTSIKRALKKLSKEVPLVTRITNPLTKSLKFFMNSLTLSAEEKILNNKSNMNVQNCTQNSISIISKRERIMFRTATTSTFATSCRGRQLSSASNTPLSLLLLCSMTMCLLFDPMQCAEQRTNASPSVFARPLITNDMSDDNSFHPIIPKNIPPENITRNVFTETGQYRVFQPVDSDLRATVSIGRVSQPMSMQLQSEKVENLRTEKPNILPFEIEMTRASVNRSEGFKSINSAESLHEEIQYGGAAEIRSAEPINEPLGNMSTINDGTSMEEELHGLEELLFEYVENFFNKGQIEPLPGLVLALQKNHTNQTDGEVFKGSEKKRIVRSTFENASLNVNIPRALQSGRLLFFTGLKKIMWPIYMGLQILKSLLVAMLLPTIISSFGKLLGKGITSGSVPLFIRPMEAPQELDFRDNSFNFDDEKFMVNELDNKDGGYAYNQPEASQSQNQYAYSQAGINNQVLSRYGMTEQQLKMQDSYLSALQSLSSASFKNSNSLSGSSSGGLGGNSLLTPGRNKPATSANMNTFQSFQKVPTSSLLLSNYDPFYSPLLSRLDSVFAQLKLNSENEVCREKLICLMYAHPAKYAPYSNLVSAQLSRELNELRKPTSDNPDILRFFKYMRAAKDGQDGVDCEKTFDSCKEFKDFENPAMVSTYHDINKLVQARKMA